MAKIKIQDIDWTRWHVKDIKKASVGILDEKRRQLEKIKAIPKEKRNFKNTIKALEESDYEASDRLNKIDFLMYVSPNVDIRNLAEKISVEVRKENLELEYDRDIWRAIKEYKGRREKLSGEDKKLFDDYYKSYKRRGFDLSEKDFKRLLEVNREMTDVSTRFEKNINEYKDQIKIRENEVSGLPETYLNTLKKDGSNYVVTLSYPDYYPFMEYADSEEKRMELNEKFFKRASKSNAPVMKRILELRYEAANLLGYKNPAAYILEVKMAKKPEKVLKFLSDMERRSKKALKSELESLTTLKKEITGDIKAKVMSHDISYYSRILKERTAGIDKEEIKKHFQFEKVKAGIFEVYSILFSVKFVKEEGKFWSSDVELYKILDMSGQEIAKFFMDMHPREGKYGHAAAFGIIGGRKEDTEYVAPISCLVMNIPRPQKKQPSLLTHSEVTTFFHEFGHIMHQCLTKASYLCQSGTSVAGDFVEAPSQIFENWGWQKEILKNITAHYKTGKVMPDELINKMIASKKMLGGYFVARQLNFGLFDMDIHTKKPKDINAVYKKWSKKLIGIDLPEDSNFPAAFGHFVGYQAGYYGYLWSEVYAADMFSVFEKEGILNPKVGMKYRKEILEKGSSREEMDSIKAFLGRHPSPFAFFKDLGL